jgi:hypothetical protein
MKEYNSKSPRTKNADYVRIRFQKEDMGEMKILGLEEYDG